jgi:hypothetical protein
MYLLGLPVVLQTCRLAACRLLVNLHYRELKKRHCFQTRPRAAPQPVADQNSFLDVPLIREAAMAPIAATTLVNDLAARNCGTDNLLDFDSFQACPWGPTLPITQDTLREEESYIEICPIGAPRGHHHISRLEQPCARTPMPILPVTGRHDLPPLSTRLQMAVRGDR